GGNGPVINSCFANGQPEAAEFLAKHGAPVDVVDAAGLGRLDIVRRHFGETGAALSPAQREEMESAYFCSCWCGQAEVVEFLLERGIDPALHNAEDQIGLHCAAYGAHFDTIKVLLRHGAPVDVKNKAYRATPLDVALWVWNNSG